MNARPNAAGVVTMWGNRIVKALPGLNGKVMAYVRTRRVRRAANILSALNQFPDSIPAVVADYAYAISRTYRDVTQVINLESVLRYIEAAGIEGALVETGTYTGGASAYALRALRRLRVDKPPRSYWGFDSFEGMPSPSDQDGRHGRLWIYGKDTRQARCEEAGCLSGHDVNKADYQECLAYLRDTGYPAEQIHLIKGWFKNTLGRTRAQIGPIAVLRLDGDFYESTRIVLRELYEQVVADGAIIIDDYGSFEGCRLAVEEFFCERRIRPHLVYIDHNMRYFIKSRA